jgi:hypothetical protein
MASHPLISGYQRPTVLDGRRVNDSIDRVTWKGAGEDCSGSGYCRSDVGGQHALRQYFQPCLDRLYDIYATVVS